jgi:signal transduction histidine kinase
MLFEFIAKHRDVLIARAPAMSTARWGPRATEVESTHGVALFLDQLSARLRAGVEPGATQLESTASLRGGELLNAGLTIGQVVHDYGNICQAVTALAVESGTQFTAEDFRTLNLCLDIAIAEAVTEHSRQSEHAIISKGVDRLGFLAHELRNLLNAATLAFEALRSGNVGVAGSTGNLLGKCLAGMGDIVSRSLAEVRLEAGLPREERISLAQLLEEIEIAGALQANTLGVQLAIEPAEPDVMIDGDSQIVASIVTNLVQNACKFTRPHGRVTVRTHVTSDRVMIDVADECGGLPPGKIDELFRPYEQRGADRSGLGLGLAISLKGARAIGGELHVRNVPGTGCVFTVELRRSPAPSQAERR